MDYCKHKINKIKSSLYSYTTLPPSEHIIIVISQMLDVLEVITEKLDMEQD